MTFSELAMVTLCGIEDERATEKHLPDDPCAHAAYDLGYAAAVRRMRAVVEVENAKDVVR